MTLSDFKYLHGYILFHEIFALNDVSIYSNLKLKFRESVIFCEMLKNFSSELIRINAQYIKVLVFK